MNIQITGNATIIGSKALSDTDKDKVLQAADGHVKVVRLTLLDTNGKEVVLEGKLYKSKSGSLTSRIVLQTESCQIVETEVKLPDGEKVDLLEELGL